MVEIIYTIIPKTWKSKLLEQGFDPVEHTLQEFKERLERYELCEGFTSTTNQKEPKPSTEKTETNKKCKGSTNQKEETSGPPYKKTEKSLHAPWPRTYY